MILRKTTTIAALAFAAVGAAIWAPVEKDVPVDSLIPNLEKAVRENPKDAQAHYVLGRVHSMAFATGKQTVQIIPPDRRDPDQAVESDPRAGRKSRTGGQGPDIFPGYSTVRVQLDRNAPMTPERLRHLRRSLEEYGKATQLDPKNPLYFLGLGWMHEMAAGVKGQPVESHRKKALAAYHTVIRLRAAEERAMETYGLSPDTRIAREAALGIVRLLEGQTGPAAEKERQRLTAFAKEMAKKPFPVTPILVPLAGETSLADLLDPSRTTRFDLAGDGLRREWPWVRPSTGILVWDPRNTGQIASGRQLFGSATWWMFFRDGYEALASLDADRDGWLTGRELNGIRVWRDANSNGKSDPGEVQPLATWGITGLNTKPSHRDANGPRADRGVLRAGGGTAPTFDWVPSPIPDRGAPAPPRS